MAQWIIKANERVIPRRTSRPLKVDEIHSETDLKKCDIFDGLIDRIWGTSTNPPTSYMESDKEYKDYS